MKVLIIGGTGTVGTYLVGELQARGVVVRILTRRKPEPGKLPAHVEFAVADMLDPATLEQAMEGMDELFLLNAVAAEELTQVLIVLGAAKQRRIAHITYLSVLQAERFPNVPNFAAKRVVEIALQDLGLPHTNLRPGYFFQNDLWVKDAFLRRGKYPMPIGTDGIAGIDARDIAAAAAIMLTTDGNDGETYGLVSSEPLSGPHSANTWG